MTTLLMLYIVVNINEVNSQNSIYYDDLYRIDSILTSGNKIYFSYDSNGNRLSRNITLTGIIVNIKVFLQASYDETTGEMKDELRQLELLPTTEPFTNLDYTHVGGGGEQLNEVVFRTTNSSGIVDWGVIELRDQNDPNIILATQSVLLQKNGRVVSTDGISPPVFSNLQPERYYVAFRHQNHLGVMTANDTMLTRDLSTPLIDFTAPTTATYGVDAQKDINGVMVLWGGNVTPNDNYVRATPRILPPPPLASDITYILDDILSGDPKATYSDYSTGDANMDGKIRMTPQIFPPPGIPSDATFILDEVLNGDPNASRQEQFE